MLTISLELCRFIVHVSTLHVCTVYEPIWKMQPNERGLPQRNRSFPVNFSANPGYGSLTDFVNIIIFVRFLSFRLFHLFIVLANMLMLPW